MVLLINTLDLPRCPHCQIANPYLPGVNQIETTDANEEHKRLWSFFRCASCGGVIMISHYENSGPIEIYPKPIVVDKCIPEKAREFLSQAISTQHAPAGSIMLSASSIDSMLKDKGYKEGNLYKRIQKAATDHLITESMAEWANLIRLEANDQRHADENVDLPKAEDAKKIVEFALALAQFLYVLPDRVSKGIEFSKQ